MASASVLSQNQFSGTRQKRRDPKSDNRKPKFSGAEGGKTMTVAGGHVPPPQSRHRHHRKNSPKGRRAVKKG
jgi:hypothetical protein